MLVRLAQLGDVAAIRDCVGHAYAPYVERMGKKPAPMLDDYHTLVERGVVSVASPDSDSESVILGLIVMWPKDDHFYIDNIAVHPDHHGRGVGAALLAEADRSARLADRNELRLYTNIHMTENLSFYPRRGFTETHRGFEAGYERIYFSRPVL